MAKINGFDFSQFDIGGKGATAGDNKLTGEEVTKARNAGWCVWDGMTKDEKPPKMEENFGPNNKNVWDFKPQPAPMPTFIDESNDRTFYIPYDGNDLGFGESLLRPVLTKAEVKEFYDKYLNK